MAKMNKRGQQFMLDVAIFAVIIIAATTLVVNTRIDTEPADNTATQAESVKLLQNAKLSSIDPTMISYLRSASEFTCHNENPECSGDTSVAKQMAIYINHNEEPLAEELCLFFLNASISTDLNFAITIQDNSTGDVTYVCGRGDYDSISSQDLVSTEEIPITGTSTSNPVNGKIVKMFLKSLVNVSKSEYVFFGGFLGQGEITVLINNIPTDADIEDIYFEGIIGGDAIISVNNVECGYVNRSGNIGGEVEDIEISVQELPSNCSNEINPGYQNELKISFVEDIFVNKYLAGGFVRVDYFSESNQESNSNIEHKRFPGIKEGVVNLYDSILTKDEIVSMDLHLEYNNPESNDFFVSFGNYTIYENNTNGSIVVDMDNSEILSVLGLSDFESFDQETIPLRIGIRERNETGFNSPAISAAISRHVDMGFMMGTETLVGSYLNNTYCMSLCPDETKTCTYTNQNEYLIFRDINLIETTEGFYECVANPSLTYTEFYDFEDYPATETLPINLNDSNNNFGFVNFAGTNDVQQGETQYGDDTIDGDCQGPTYCPSGDYCLGTNLSGCYVDNVPWASLFYFETSIIDLTAANSGKLIINHWLDRESGDWQPFINVMDVWESGYVQLLDSAFPYTSSNHVWTEEDFDLTSYIGHRIYMRFASLADGSGSAAGWYVDNWNLTINYGSNVTSEQTCLAADVYDSTGYNRNSWYHNGSDPNYDCPDNYCWYEEDVEMCEIASTRMGVVKDALTSFINSLSSKVDSEFGLYPSGVVPTDSCFSETPLTNNKSVVLEDLSTYDLSGCGDNDLPLEDLINGSVQQLILSNSSSKNVILFIEDDILSPYDMAADICTDYGITLFAIAVSGASIEDARDVAAVNNASGCGGMHFIATNPDDLEEALEVIENTILYRNQVLNSAGGGLVELSEDSYLRIEYENGSLSQPDFGEIRIDYESDHLSGCSVDADVIGVKRVDDGIFTSYSGDRWTNFLEVGGEEVFDLSSYGSTYTNLGDPFKVYVPTEILVPGTNHINTNTASSPSEIDGCSRYNKLIYTGFMSASVSNYDIIRDKSDGCSWTIEFENGETSVLDIPANYSGSNSCHYTSSNVDYANDDVIAITTYEFLQELDVNDNQMVDITLSELDFDIDHSIIEQVPYQWGPAWLRMTVWRRTVE